LAVWFSLAFILVFASIKAIGTFGIPFTSFDGREGVLRRQAFRTLEHVADEKKTQIRQWLSGLQSDARVFAIGGAFEVAALCSSIRATNLLRGETGPEDFRRKIGSMEGYRDVVTYFSGLLQSHSQYREILVAEAETGRILASTTSKSVGTIASSDPAFVGALKVGGPYLSHATPLPAESASLLYVGVPVEHSMSSDSDAEPQVAAVMILSVTLSTVLQPILSTVKGLDDSSEVLLMNPDGLTLGRLKHRPPDWSKTVPMQYTVTSRSALFACAGKEGLLDSIDYRNVPVLSAFRHLQVNLDWGWGLVVKSNKEEIYAPIRMDLVITVSLVLVGTLVFIAIAILLARGLTKPLCQLGLTAEIVSSGDYSARSGLKRRDEVGVLATTFNEMLDRIEDWQRDLEIKVAERTSELRLSGEALQEEMGRRTAAETDVRLGEERFRMLFEQAVDSIYLLDEEGRFIEVNTAGLKSHGYTLSEFIGLSYSEVVVHRLADAGIERWLQELRAGLARSYEAHHRRKDGTTYPVEVRARLVEGKEGPLILAMARDITERRSQEEAKDLAEKRNRQQQRLEAIGTLASGVAHEINNPLNVVSNFTQLTLDQMEPGSKEAKRLTTIQSAVGRIGAIIKDLLAFARAESGVSESADMREIVTSTLTLTRTDLEIDGVKIVVRLPDELPMVKCRNQEIQQVLMNLLTNARDALNERFPGHHKEKRLFIELTRWLKGGEEWVRLTVEDHGTGIPADLEEQIFDPFFTTKATDKGTGLGLSISHGIATDHGGKLSMESETGKWTRFHLDLRTDDGLAGG